MSKRTLDSFLLPPPSSSSPATHKRTKHDPPEHRSGAQKHVALKGSTKKSNSGIEVLELDEVIVLDTPSPSPEPSISLVIRKDKLSTSTLQDDDQRSPVGKSSTLLQSENEQNISSITDLTPFHDAPLIPPSELAHQTVPPDRHSNYPFPMPSLLPHISTTIATSPTSRNKPTTLTHLPHLDLLHYEPYLDSKTAREYGEFLRRELPFYRVEYKITRFGKVTDIRTPRYTTVFGVDETSRFTPAGDLIETSTGKPIAKTKYKTAKPRPIPSCLDVLRRSVEKATSTTYNYALVNYYSTGADSISYHSDDEHFLEREPAIASFSFLGRRDFLMKHKPVFNTTLKPKATTTATGTTGGAACTSASGDEPTLTEITKAATNPLRFSLTPGTLILMRGQTQSNWLHSIPKRAGDGGGGRINITFRRNMTPAGTENYYRYNVGGGGVWKWDEKRREMRLSGLNSGEGGGA